MVNEFCSFLHILTHSLLIAAFGQARQPFFPRLDAAWMSARETESRRGSVGRFSVALQSSWLLGGANSGKAPCFLSSCCFSINVLSYSGEDRVFAWYVRAIWELSIICAGGNMCLKLASFTYVRRNVN